MANLNSKKKAELIEIILRKDEVERGLRLDNKGMEEKINTMLEEYNKDLFSANKALEDSNNLINKLNAEKYVLRNDNMRLRRRNKLWFSVAIVMTIAAVLAIVL